MAWFTALWKSAGFFQSPLLLNSSKNALSNSLPTSSTSKGLDVCVIWEFIVLIAESAYGPSITTLDTSFGSIFSLGFSSAGRDSLVSVPPVSLPAFSLPRSILPNISSADSKPAPVNACFNAAKNCCIRLNNAAIIPGGGLVPPSQSPNASAMASSRMASRLKGAMSIMPSLSYKPLA